MNSIPIIDIEAISQNNSDSEISMSLSSASGKKLKQEIECAFEEYGFMLIVNHGISKDTVSEHFWLFCSDFMICS